MRLFALRARVPVVICASVVSQDEMEALESEYGRVQEDYDSAAKRFGEDPTKCPSGEFFSLVSVRVRARVWVGVSTFATIFGHNIY